ncbi:ABC transporter ATP-binding protein [Desulfonatronovibrio magnus]|uniref:ABC transporter ATP-binding protein n=1 Tax=Desulfonatronovibrio magnus TaxID=698827 RepID=UPI0005EB0077|nr:oligopeptide/dipeptide ABC transporter ATP-binding protein [Desulfonatronovibrio magnus]
MSRAYLSLENITKSYAVKTGSWFKTTNLIKAVHNVSMSVQKGETLGLVGESGCGKSTLGKIACGLEVPTSGEVFLDGQRISTSSDLLKSKKIQMIFQDPFSSLNPRQKIKNIISEPLKIHKVGTYKEIMDKTRHIMDTVGLSASFMNRYPHEFSGGQRQRIAIARAISLDPDMVICDEPVSALDVSVQAQILNLLQTLQHELNLSYLFISHDLSVVKYLCTRILVMYFGQLMEEADKDDLYKNPCHPYTQALLGAVPVPVPGKKIKSMMIQADPPNPLKPPSGCPFHPRCPKRIDICSQHDPGWTRISSHHAVRCFLFKSTPDHKQEKSMP